jgi:hypothetical protein
MSTIRTHVLTGALGALVSLAGCSPIVGGACIPGTIVCEGACVDPRTDETACGGCGQACGEGTTCVESRCVVPGDDAGPADAWPTDGFSPDAGVPDAPGLVPDGGDAGTIDVGTGDGGVMDPDGGAPLDVGTDDPDGGVPVDVGTDEPDAGEPIDTGADDPDAGMPIDAGADRLDASRSDDAGTEDPDAGSEGGDVDGGVPPDGGPLACELGTTACDGRCVDLAVDVTSCGGCGIRCGAEQLCADGACVDRCGPGTVACGSACVDLMTDPDNCGACGRECPSGICTLGVCTGALAGHLVAIGHDYTTHRAAMDRLLANAVLLAAGSPIRVLTYRGLATAASVAGAESAIGSTAVAMGRELTWERVVDAELASSQLREADVFLIHAQAGGTDERMVLLGLGWSRALVGFLERGGVVVMLDGPAPHRGTFGILEAAGLLTSSGLTEITLETVNVVAPWDGVTIGVPLSYRAELSSVRFDDADLPVVVRDAAGGAVVLHRTVVP